ncbi:radical SAM family heme chaperone HemW [Mucilaginibacter achroorhodeus]|uniref:Heme chaperone HemW n=1 Tax=Mucilaginibacter achroorhodeus TaxID=2599294 RepID=A0A563TYD5_9SPHI|nr:radical SAM family heme chaperone HemW [Mucilaginibacter achroorhodeus]TWR23752.1 radical SAM family heme chaperone HemW [Mucilaginibacter achroorhodeus]
MAGIYIHIPFCKQACHYCDFHFSTSLKYKDQMLDAMLRELELQKDYLHNETIETIYFGGGTPSVLSADEVNSLINRITQLHSVSGNAEITLEANPDDLGREKINALRKTPVNRFSIGIQSFFDDDLAWMNRVHRAQEAEASVKRAQDAGFENITADLVYGYPLLTDNKWKQNLDTMFGLDIPHISAYSMTVEPQTALAAFISKKKQPPMDEQQSAAQFADMLDAMQGKGFEQYEISNFCKPGHYSRHNSNYWKGVKYLGIGPSAHSFNGQTRQWNIANNAKYLHALGSNTVPAEIETLSEADRLNEYIMTSLRTMWGLDLTKLDSIAAGASSTLIKVAEGHISQGKVLNTGNILTLTSKGKLYADAIAAEMFFDVEH